VEPPPEHCPGTGTELSGTVKLQFSNRRTSFLFISESAGVAKINEVMDCSFYVPETHIMYLTHCC